MTETSNLVPPEALAFASGERDKTEDVLSKFKDDKLSPNESLVAEIEEIDKFRQDFRERERRAFVMAAVEEACIEEALGQIGMQNMYPSVHTESILKRIIGSINRGVVTFGGVSREIPEDKKEDQINYVRDIQRGLQQVREGFTAIAQRDPLKTQILRKGDLDQDGALAELLFRRLLLDGNEKVKRDTLAQGMRKSTSKYLEENSGQVESGYISDEFRTYVTRLGVVFTTSNSVLWDNIIKYLYEGDYKGIQAVASSYNTKELTDGDLDFEVPFIISGPAGFSRGPVLQHELGHAFQRIQHSVGRGIGDRDMILGEREQLRLKDEIFRHVDSAISLGRKVTKSPLLLSDYVRGNLTSDSYNYGDILREPTPAEKISTIRVFGKDAVDTRGLYAEQLKVAIRDAVDITFFYREKLGMKLHQASILAHCLLHEVPMDSWGVMKEILVEEYEEEEVIE